MPIRPHTAAATFALATALLGCPEKKAEPTVEAPAHTEHAATPTPPAAPARSASFLFPHDNSTVFAEVDVAVVASGMKLRAAGEDINDKTSGHFALLVDGQPVPAGTAVPTDDKSVHLEKGESEAHVKLPVGKHTIVAQLLDGDHKSYGPELATTLHVDVVAAPAKVGVSFLEPKDGAKVKSPLAVKFGVEGFTLKPVGEAPLDKTTGHHHLIVDGASIALGTVVPANETHIHFGKAQTETSLPLTPGKHTLTLQLADGSHISYGKNLSATITVDVEGP